jgi:nucleotide-binding universal stress UspA family protein
VLHVRLDAVNIAVKTASEQGGPLVEHLIQHINQDAHERETRARLTFEDFCMRENVPLEIPGTAPPVSASAEWHVETGDEPDLVASHGMLSDLVICARSPNFTTRLILEKALLNTGRPLLIPSAAAGVPRFCGGTAVIAWKPTVQAARAVAAAMPLLARAEEVVLMTVEEGSAPQTHRLIRNLTWHGLRVSAEHLAAVGADPAKTLLEAAAKKGSLLIMGGYGQSRIREWVFGGFTQRALAEAQLAVFMSH